MYSIRYLMVISFMINTIVTQGKQECQNTNCECIQNEEEGIEYHCPFKNWNRKFVISVGNDYVLTWQCKSIEDLDKHLSNIKLSAKQLTIFDCTLTAEAASNLPLDYLEDMKIENCTLKSGFVQALSSHLDHRIKSLTLESVMFDDDVDFENFLDPDLAFLELRNVDIFVGKKIFQNNSQITALYLTSNHITLLDELSFSHLVMLETLDLSDNKIVSLKAEVFKGLSNLVNLYLHTNKIKKLEKRTFIDLINVVSLDLSFNKICLLLRDVLKPLKSLMEIFLNNNVGLELDDYLFSNFTQLTSISLQFSNLKYIPENVFSGSIEIRRINLKNNLISHISNSLFDGLTKLEILNIENNVIHSIETNAFRSLRALKELYLRENRIKGLYSALLEPLVQLEYIDVSYNYIGNIGNHCFAEKENLREINLSHNRYKYVVESNSEPKWTPFSKCNNLRILDLSFNLLEDIPEELFHTAPNLERLSLDGNKMKSLNLTSVWKTAYKGIMISLEENEIAKFIFDERALPEEAEEDDNEHVTQVLLSLNPLNCDCDAEAFLNFINEVMRKEADWGIIFLYADLRCASPPKVKGLKFSEISRYVSDCRK